MNSGLNAMIKTTQKQESNMNQSSEKRLVTPMKKPYYIRPYSSDKFSTHVKKLELRNLEQRIDAQLNTVSKLSLLYTKAKERKLIG
jgi:hypothetical protein